MDMAALSPASEEIDHIRLELVLALEAKDAAVKTAKDSRNAAEGNSKRVSELSQELNFVKESLVNLSEQLVVKEEDKEAMRIELEKTKHLAVELEEKDALIEKLKQELSNVKDSESHVLNCLSETKTKLQMLEDGMEKAKESELKMSHSLTSQTEQLDQTRNLLEEARLEVTSLTEKVENLARASEQSSSTDPRASHLYLGSPNPNSQSIEETTQALMHELESVKEHLSHAKEGEAQALSKFQSLTQEMDRLKTELKAASDAEVKSRKAMDDLALTLKEVLTESNLMKERLLSSESVSDSAKEEVEHLRQMLKSREEKYVVLLNEARKENERIKDESERLKVETEELNMAWNAKELGFISCIRRAEKECLDAKQENKRLLEATRQAEHTIRSSREETYKLRDILKQALNEANVAKEASTIAQVENYQLKDSLAEKDITLQDLTRENERLRINEAAALENIKELKRLLSVSATASTTTAIPPLATTATTATPATPPPATATAMPPPIPSPKPAGSVAELKEPEAFKNKENREGKKLAKVLHVDLEDIRVPSRCKDSAADSEIEETLKGSIFDVDSPVPIAQHCRASSLVTDVTETINSEDLDNLEGSHLDDFDHDRNGHRKKKALMRKFGDLLKITSFHRREATIS